MIRAAIEAIVIAAFVVAVVVVVYAIGN